MYIVVFAASAAILTFGLWKLLSSFILWYTSPLWDLPGPPSSSLFMGNIKDITVGKKDGMEQYEIWSKKYGHAFRYAGFLNENRLFTMDLKAMGHVLAHPDDYQRPQEVQYALSRVLGTGLLVVEGDKHRQERKVMNPAFGPLQVRALTEIFNEKSSQLCDVLSAEIAAKGDHESQGLRLDVLPWLAKMTLDAIGLAGFNYKFDALNIEAGPNELNATVDALFKHAAPLDLLNILQTLFPITRIIPNKDTSIIRQARATMDRIGAQLMAEAKADASAEKDGTKNRDLLSVLVRANMSSDVRPDQRLSDDDVRNQVPTFLIAGHETTSTSAAWALCALARRPDIQAELRKELQTLHSTNPTMEELNALPYLECVVREVLRLHAPVPNTLRYVARDGVMPLDNPVKDKNGVLRKEIRVQRGDKVFVPILAINRNKDLWGEDAEEFRPERWRASQDSTPRVPFGVWGNMLTFLAGPHACIGYRFSLVELKSLLFALIRSFDFELGVPEDDLGVRHAVVQRPMVRSEPEKGAQMPVVIRPLAARES